MTAKVGKGAERKAVKAPEPALRSRQASLSKASREWEKDDDPGPEEAPEGVELLPLESLEPAADESEVAETAGSEPEQDSPGDTAVLEQEELYEGISSGSEPDGKREGHQRNDEDE